MTPMPIFTDRGFPIYYELHGEGDGDHERPHVAYGGFLPLVR